MCGIAGCVLEPGRRPDQGALARLAAALHHRGPDDEGIAVVDNAGLVHRRLSIVDPRPEAGHGPMRREGWWLTYNGEVFNHLDLRGDLGAVPWRGGSDTETVLEALAAWGEDAVPRLNGLYAFAALDLARRRLLLVRDRFGVKPLYYARHDGGLWFASEIGALLAAGVPRRADRALLHEAVGAGWLNGPRTWVEGVFRLLPGRMMSVSLDDLSVQERVWYEPAEVVDRRRRDGDVEDALRTAVRRRLMADVPVGTMCSGGLDSSLVAACARDEHPDIRAYNAAITDQPEVDEGPWAAKVAEALGIELRTVTMTADDWRAGLVATCVHNEHPLVHESSVPMAAIAALAHRDGVKVLLSGEAADELFGGYPWRHAAPRFPWRVPAPPAPTEPGEAAYASDVRARAARAYGRGPRGRAAATLLADLRLYLPHLLNRQDKNTMQHSVETRVPFLDPDLVRLAVNLPLRARLDKRALREVAARLLPGEVARRPKVGFGFGVDRYLAAARPAFLRDGALREELGIEAAAWREGLGALRGQRLLLAVSGEVLCRALLHAEPVETVERELWG